MSIARIPLSKIKRCRWRDEDDSPEKIKVAVERITRQGFRGHLDGRKLPNGEIEQLNGHNRVTALRKIGHKTVPMEVKEYTDEEALDIFLSDNMKEDGQSTGWALGAVRNVIPHLVALGTSIDDARKYLATKIGLEAVDIVRLAEMNTAIDSGYLTSSVKRLLAPYHAIEYWRKLRELKSHRPVDMSEQDSQIEVLVASRDIRGKIRTLFWDALKEQRPTKTRIPRVEPSPFETVSKLLDRLIPVLQENGEDFTPEQLKNVATKLDSVCLAMPEIGENI